MSLLRDRALRTWVYACSHLTDKEHPVHIHLMNIVAQVDPVFWSDTKLSMEEHDALTVLRIYLVRRGVMNESSQSTSLLDLIESVLVYVSRSSKQDLFVRYMDLLAPWVQIQLAQSLSRAHMRMKAAPQRQANNAILPAQESKSVQATQKIVPNSRGQVDKKSQENKQDQTPSTENSHANASMEIQNTPIKIQVEEVSDEEPDSSCHSNESVLVNDDDDDNATIHALHIIEHSDLYLRGQRALQRLRDRVDMGSSSSSGLAKSLEEENEALRLELMNERANRERLLQTAQNFESQLSALQLSPKSMPYLYDNSSSSLRTENVTNSYVSNSNSHSSSISGDDQNAEASSIAKRKNRYLLGEMAKLDESMDSKESLTKDKSQQIQNDSSRTISLSNVSSASDIFFNEPWICRQRRRATRI